MVSAEDPGAPVPRPEEAADGPGAPARVPTTRQLIGRIGATLVTVELSIMATLMGVPESMGPYSWAVLDAVILLLVSIPIIYFWIVKPYVVAHDRALERISAMANHDALTKLANRRLLAEYLEKLMPEFARYEQHGALLLIDLDGFKPINDEHGHDAGDAVLVALAHRLTSFVRAGDIASRLGGDEFVVVLGRLDAAAAMATEEAEQIAGRIREELRRPVEFQGEQLRVDSSIGIRMLTPEPAGMATVLKEADQAMYRAKRAGGGSAVVFEPARSPAA